MVCSVLGCALFIPGGVLFIPRGCLIHPHPALIIPRVGLNWSPGMNRSLYLNSGLLYRILTKLREILVNLGVFFSFLSFKRRLRALKTVESKSGAKRK